jgi:hypothetical protein
MSVSCLFTGVVRCFYDITKTRKMVKRCRSVLCLGANLLARIYRKAISVDTFLSCQVAI